MQRRVQLAEQVTENAMSGVARIADETHRTREVAEATIAEVRSVHGEVQSKVASANGMRRCECYTHSRGILGKCTRGGRTFGSAGITHC